MKSIIRKAVKIIGTALWYDSMWDGMSDSAKIKAIANSRMHDWSLDTVTDLLEMAKSIED